MAVRGRRFLAVGLLLVIAATIGLFFMFRQAVLHRFSIGIYSFGETPDIKPARKLWFVDLSRNQPLSMDKSVIVWIEGGTAGKTNLTAVAYLFTDTGEALSMPQQLVVKQNYKNKTVEEAVFPMPKELRAGKVLGVLVMRLPAVTESMKESFLEKTKHATGQLERIAKMKLLCATLGGYAEFAIVHIAKE